MILKHIYPWPLAFTKWVWSVRSNGEKKNIYIYIHTHAHTQTLFSDPFISGFEMCLWFHKSCYHSFSFVHLFHILERSFTVQLKIFLLG